MAGYARAYTQGIDVVSIDGIGESVNWTALYGHNVQVSTGCASFILGIANAVTCASYGVLGFGLWCGVLVSKSFFAIFL